MRRLVVATLLLAFAPVALAADPAPAAAAAQPLGAKAAFEQLKTLEGDWEGTAMGGGANKEIPAKITYRLASGGTVVMETLFPNTPHEMISMYHLSGPDLVVSHFCAMGNQPRMKLDPKSTAEELRFQFDGGQNLDPAKDTHVHAGWLKPGKDTLTASWAVWAGGKETGAHRFKLQRKTAARPATTTAPPATR